MVVCFSGNDSKREGTGMLELGIQLTSPGKMKSCWEEKNRLPHHHKGKQQQLGRVITFLPCFLFLFTCQPFIQGSIFEGGWVSEFVFSDVAQGCCSQQCRRASNKSMNRIQSLPARDPCPRSACTEESSILYLLVWTPPTPFLRYPWRIPFRSPSPFSSFCLVRFLTGKCALN